MGIPSHCDTVTPRHHQFLQTSRRHGHGRVVHWEYVGTPPRTLAYLCAHELTHVIVRQHVGLIGRFRVPRWVFEGFADYVGIENRQPFEPVERRTRRPTCRRSHDGEVWQLSALPPARHVLYREAGMVGRPAPPNEADRRRGERCHARGRKAISAAKHCRAVLVLIPKPFARSGVSCTRIIVQSPHARGRWG
jgi:hypothetical protein